MSEPAPRQTDGARLQLGVVGLGRMGSGLVRRLAGNGISTVVHDVDPTVAPALAAELGEPVVATASLSELAAGLPSPRAVWVMVPADVAGAVVTNLATSLSPGDVIIDGGNTDWREDAPRAVALAERRIALVDVGTSGGVWGAERGYCLMVGGPDQAVAQLAPVFDVLSPGIDAATRTRGRDGEPDRPERGWLHCGPTGAGHFVKMVHNGIEYGLMAAYAEGLNLLAHAGRYGFDVDLADVAELWRRGSVVGSWLLDLIAAGLVADPELSAFTGFVDDSGEGRWALEAAVDLAVPTPVLASALFARFSSRGEAAVANRVLSAMRNEFGGHVERPGP